MVRTYAIADALRFRSTRNEDSNIEIEKTEPTPHIAMKFVSFIVCNLSHNIKKQQQQQQKRQCGAKTK